MRYLYVCFFTVTLFSNSKATEKLAISDQLAIRKVITTIASSDKEAISKIVDYPLKRQYPLPNIKNEKDFQERFEQLFDEALLKEIKNSSINRDWAEAGWRGIMFSNGKLWIDETGKIIAVNYETNKQKQLRKMLVDNERKALHESLREYEKPVLRESGKDYEYRVDLLKEKEQNYRLVLWKKGERQNSKPVLVLENGKLKFDGSGGNHHYIFVKQKLIYVVDAAIVAAKDTPGTRLIIEEKSNSIYSQE